MDVGGSPYNCVSHGEEVPQPQYPRDPQFALVGGNCPSSHQGRVQLFEEPLQLYIPHQSLGLHPGSQIV